MSKPRRSRWDAVPAAVAVAPPPSDSANEAASSAGSVDPKQKV